MRQRMLVVLMVFVTLAVASFAVPLLASTAGERTQELTHARGADLDRFATLADRATVTGDTSTVISEVSRYTELYGEALVIVDARRDPVVQTGGLRAGDPAVARLLDNALRNQAAPPIPALRPWSQGYVMMARPIGTGIQVTGAVVLRVSVRAAAADVARSWAIGLAGTALIALACVLLAYATARWVVRPLHRLDRAVGLLAAGRSAAPFPAPIGGPPELRELAQGFDRMSRSVLAALEQQRRLVADTSHQLRNPMAALRLRIDSLEPRLPASAGRTYAGIATELERMEAILDGLLTLAGAEHRAGEAAALIRPDAAVSCDAVELLSGQVQFWDPVARHHGVRLVAAATGPPAPVACAPGELAQILDVLLDNAIKYGGEGATVRLDCRAEGPWVAIGVRDDGPGLDDDQLALAVGRFWRAGHHQRLPGSGLGLPIAAQLATGRGGHLELTRAQPRGLRAEVVLPRAPDGPDRPGGSGEPL
ncbi:ATP-binding protein [Streptomyces sp. NPDC087850]|uniref:sensor histidine kinase n=1 Tax=Streptomyces sp. NPDC087850 TaxID=3365809 RepID=UPI0038078A70